MNAINIGKEIKDSEMKSLVKYTGHSLGGGLASAAVLAANTQNDTAKAYTFNAAGLLSNTVQGNTDAAYNYANRATSLIEAYSITTDILTVIQDKTALQSAIGDRSGEKKMTGPFGTLSQNGAWSAVSTFMDVERKWDDLKNYFDDGPENATEEEKSTFLGGISQLFRSHKSNALLRTLLGETASGYGNEDY